MSARPTTVDVEDVGTTKSEKLLAIVLGVFLLLGTLWAYDQLGEWGRSTFEPSVAAVDRAAADRLIDAENGITLAASEEARALDALVLAREAYRTALDADEPAEALRRAYEARRREHADAQARARAARATAAALRPAGEAASERIAAAENRAADRGALLGFGLRFALVGCLLGAGLWLMAALRRTGSRWLPMAFSLVGCATLLAVGLAGDYVTDYVDPLDLGPLVLSLAGIAATLLGFAALQRFLARRLPARRVRKNECPFCGYPVGDGSHCEGCGREVVAACARCSAPRRVGTLHCRACGAA